MTDYNTWNESLIEAVRKSSLFEDGGVQDSEHCSRCKEIILNLMEVSVEMTANETLDDVEGSINYILEGEHHRACLTIAFTFSKTAQGSAYWWDQVKFLGEGHNCIRDGHDDD